MNMLYGDELRPPSTIRSVELPLSGTAAGGTLYLFQAGVLKWISVETIPGELPECVLNRLAAKINMSFPFGAYGPWGPTAIGYDLQSPKSQLEVVAVSNKLGNLPFGRWFFTGTDTGFMIPQPPRSVSGRYDREKQVVVVIWMNPQNEYDQIRCGSDVLPPTATSNAFDVRHVPESERFGRFWLVFGSKGQMLSPPGVITVWSNAQEELVGFPFYRGIAPNWSAWSSDAEAGGVAFMQGIKPQATNEVDIDRPDDKPFYQIIRTSKPGVKAGVFRRFLGLIPKHTYKIEVRLNTLEMDACTTDWEFSCHAAYDNQDGLGLSIGQMLGLEELPNGTTGPLAGCFALYKNGTTTKGKWVKRSTDDIESSLHMKNITLPENVSSITVWLRHGGADSTGVGMDWIRVEDVTKQ